MHHLAASPCRHLTTTTSVGMRPGRRWIHVWQPWSSPWGGGRAGARRPLIDLRSNHRRIQLLAPPDPVASGRFAPPTGQIWPLPRALDQHEEEEPCRHHPCGPLRLCASSHMRAPHRCRNQPLAPTDPVASGRLAPPTCQIWLPPPPRALDQREEEGPRRHP
jgi:hypothetical protein